jgi:hypothetical protein
MLQEACQRGYQYFSTLSQRLFIHTSNVSIICLTMHNYNKMKLTVGENSYATEKDEDFS